MNLIKRIKNWLNPAKEKELKVALTTTKVNGELYYASVDHYVDGKFVSIATFSTIEDAYELYKLLTSNHVVPMKKN